MGIVSVISVVAGLAFMVALHRRMNLIAEEEGDEHVSWLIRWGARASLLVALLGTVGLVDAYIYQLPSPFDPDEIELPAEHEPSTAAEAPEIKPAEKPDPMKEAKDQHDEALEEFSREAKQ
jgi:hypothetical protein